MLGLDDGEGVGGFVGNVVGKRVVGNGVGGFVGGGVGGFVGGGYVLNRNESRMSCFVRFIVSFMKYI